MNRDLKMGCRVCGPPFLYFFIKFFLKFKNMINFELIPSAAILGSVGKRLG